MLPQVQPPLTQLFESLSLEQLLASHLSPHFANCYDSESVEPSSACGFDLSANNIVAASSGECRYDSGFNLLFCYLYLANSKQENASREEKHIVRMEDIQSTFVPHLGQTFTHQ